MCVAKNYLGKDELDALNLIVSFYLDFAELKAKSWREMTMARRVSKLDDFLRLSERDILTHTGKVSHDRAIDKAETEYEQFAASRAALPSPVEKHFDEAIGEIKRLEGEKTKPRSRQPRPSSRSRPSQEARQEERRYLVRPVHPSCAPAAGVAAS